MIVVADAGPVLHLYWIGCLSWGLPPTTVHVVEQVWLEIERQAPDALQDARLKWNVAPKPEPEWQARFSLDAGELSAIAFAFGHPGALLLTDDDAARRACSTLGIAAAGTIGLILEAARAKRVDVSAAVRAREELPTRGRLHISKDLLRVAIGALKGGA